MKVFVAYAFRDSDRWIEGLVFPLIRAFGGTVETGSEVQGEQITEAVRQKIAGCDGLIGFLTRREFEQATTHRWVTDELATARDRGVEVVEVREEGIDPQLGMQGDLQHIPYKPDDRERMLVELAGVLGRWSRGLPKLMVLPGSIVEEIFPLLDRPDFRCECTFLQGGRPQRPEPIDLVPIGGGLFAFPRPPEGAMVSLTISSQGRYWKSSFVGWDAYGVELTAIGGG